MAKSIIDLFNDSAKDLTPVVPADKTPYYSDEKSGGLDDKSISSLEGKLGNRYGKGIGDWGSVYNDQQGKKYSDVVKKG